MWFTVPRLLLLLPPPLPPPIVSSAWVWRAWVEIFIAAFKCKHGIYLNVRMMKNSLTWQSQAFGHRALVKNIVLFNFDLYPMCVCVLVCELWAVSVHALSSRHTKQSNKWTEKRSDRKRSKLVTKEFYKFKWIKCSPRNGSDSFNNWFNKRSQPTDDHRENEFIGFAFVVFVILFRWTHTSGTTATERPNKRRQIYDKKNSEWKTQTQSSQNIVLIPPYIASHRPLKIDSRIYIFKYINISRNP